MKKLHLLLILSISIFLASCGGDDPLSTSIVDTTWQLVSIEQTGCDDPDDNIDLATADDNNCLNSDDELICNYTFQFFANGSARLQANIDGDVIMEELTYMVNDDIDEVTVCDGASIPDCIIGSADGNEMTLILNDNDGCLGKIILEKA